MTDGGTRQERRAKKELEALQEERQRVANAVVATQLEGISINALKPATKLGHEKVMSHLCALDIDNRVSEHHGRWYSECYRAAIIQEA